MCVCECYSKEGNDEDVKEREVVRTLRDEYSDVLLRPRSEA